MPVLLLIWLGVAELKTLMGMLLEVPVVWGDSALYLSRARNLAHIGWPVIENICGPDYPPLYSMLLAPAYLLHITPEASYHLCLGINALLSTSIVFPAFLIHRRLTGKNLPSLGVALLVAFLPASFVFSLTIMAENLMLPLVMWLFLAALYYPELRTRSALAVGGLAAATILTKSLAWGLLAGVLALAVTTLVENCSQTDRRRKAILSVGALLGGLALPLLLWFAWNRLSLSHSTFPLSWRGAYPMAQYWDVLTSLITDWGAAFRFLQVLSGQLAYLFFSTFGLAAIAGVAVVMVFLRNHPPDSRGPWIALLLFCAGTLFLGTIHSASYFDSSPERYSLFGRYVDSLAPLLVVIGAASLRNGRRRKTILMVVLPIAALAAFALPIPEWLWLHRVGVFYLRPIKDLAEFRFLVVGFALLPIALYFGFRRYSVQAATLLLIGSIAASTSALATSAVRARSRNVYANHPIARYLHDHFDPDRDRLLIKADDLKREGCYQGRHWIFLYETGSAPVLFSSADDLGLLLWQNEVFFATTHEIPNRAPVASEDRVQLYRIPVKNLYEVFFNTTKSR